MSQGMGSQKDDKIGNIDQIRDIIFGAQIREFTSRFDKMDATVSKIKEESRTAVQELRGQITSEIQGGLEALEKKLKSHASSVEELDGAVRKQLETAEKKIGKSLEAVGAEANAAAKAVRDELSQLRAKTTDDIRTLKTTLGDDLNQRISAVEEAHVTRDEMAELLFELGMKLKGSGLGPELAKGSKR